MSMYDALHKLSPEASQIVRFVYFRSLARAEQDLGPVKTKLSPMGEAGRGFFDALRGIYIASKERDGSSLFVKLYLNGEPKEIAQLSEKFKQEAYRATVDDYERGFLIAWEIAAKALSELKESYPDYPKEDQAKPKAAPAASGSGPDLEESGYEVMPRKKPKASPGRTG